MPLFCKLDNKAANTAGLRFWIQEQLRAPHPDQPVCFKRVSVLLILKAILKCLARVTIFQKLFLSNWHPNHWYPLDFWHLYFEKLSSTNSIFFSSLNLIFTAFVICKNPAQTWFFKLGISKFKIGRGSEIIVISPL